MKKRKEQYYDSTYTSQYDNLPITYFRHRIIPKKDRETDGKIPHVFVLKHNHAEMELLWFKHGSGFLLLGSDEEKIPFQEGDLLVINPFELHAGFYDSANIEQEHLVVDFSLSLVDLPISEQSRQIAFDLLGQKVRCRTRITPADPHHREIVDCFLNIYDQTSHGINNEFAFSAQMFLLFSYLKEDGYFYQTARMNNSEKSRRFIEKTLDYMELHYSEQITTQDVASSVGYSTEHFCRLFKEIFNTQFTVYLNQFRIEKAKQLLPSVPIAEISERCGFSSQSNFSRAFRKVTGLSPTVFRRNGQSME